MTKKLSTEEFIERVKSKYGDTYILDKVDYVNNKSEITVGCKEHGYFNVRPDLLLNGAKCPKCSKTRKTTLEEFVKKASYVHNNFFTYDSCSFENVSKDVEITCPIHGKFKQKASNHLNGYTCPKCSKERILHEIAYLPKKNKPTKKYTTQEFIERAKNVHKEKYSYGKTVYVNHKTLVTVTCKEHGDFKITPCHLLSGEGCSKCSENYRLTTQEFIERAKKIHGGKYTYDKTVYNKTHEPLIVTCKKHGDFYTSPSNFLKGTGCPHCRQSKMETEIYQMLEERGIEFIYQQRFEWLGKQSLDFFLPKYNIAIECQGLQHFESVEAFGGKDAFIKTVKYDSLKKSLCDEHGVKLIYYSNLDIKYPYEVFENKEKLVEFITS